MACCLPTCAKDSFVPGTVVGRNCPFGACWSDPDRCFDGSGAATSGVSLLFNCTKDAKACLAGTGLRLVRALLPQLSGSPPDVQKRSQVDAQTQTIINSSM